MKNELVDLQNVQVIGMSKEIAFNNPSECSKFWGEYVERIVKPVNIEGKEPDGFQKAAVENNVGEFGRDVTAAEIHKAATSILSDSKTLSENVQLSVCSSRYSLPYYQFDASDMNSRDPKLFYVNNQLKFKACEVDFGTGLPLRAQQAMLPDMIKFWQEEPGGPVQIIYGGFASKIMRRK